MKTIKKDSIVPVGEKVLSEPYSGAEQGIGYNAGKDMTGFVSGHSIQNNAHVLTDNVNIPKGNTGLGGKALK